MCSIIGSFKKEKLKELYELNSYRGQYAHSVSYYDIVTGNISVQRGGGVVDFDSIIQKPLVYMIVHSQAPTTESEDIHPAYYDGRFLWHNGILKQSYINELKEKLSETSNWDTFLLLKSISKDRENLNNLDGSFSCLLYDHEKLYLFRNEISPMFYDANLNMSSTRFNGSYTTEPNCLYHVDFNFSTIFRVKTFTTVLNPYYFAE
jgi:asparagine synthetase B (glutamine-hydrolysing)